MSTPVCWRGEGWTKVGSIYRAHLLLPGVISLCAFRNLPTVIDPSQPDEMRVRGDNGLGWLLWSYICDSYTLVTPGNVIVLPHWEIRSSPPQPDILLNHIIPTVCEPVLALARLESDKYKLYKSLV